MAGLVTGFIPGGNIASGALGVGSTLATYGADLSRNGFNWKDLGYAGFGLGMDALSFIPGVGTMAKTAKLGKNV
jgi:hypothetical protein